MRAAIERYLSLTCGNDEPGEGRIAALACALDDLLVGLRDLEDGQPSEGDTEALRMDYQAVYAEIGRRFPELGLYPSADPLDLAATEILVGDAVDDAADIAVDLAEALWLWDNIGAADAHWELRFGFDHHWGQHLVDLRRYLHALARAEMSTGCV